MGVVVLSGWPAFLGGTLRVVGFFFASGLVALLGLYPIKANVSTESMSGTRG